MKSLRLRLTLGLCLSLMIIFFLLWRFTTHAIEQLSAQYVAMHLQHDGETLLRAINIDQHGQISLDSKWIEPVYLRPFSGQYFRIEMEQKVIRSRSLWDQDFSMPVLSAGEKRQLYITGPQQQPLVVWIHGYTIQGNTVTIAVAENLSPLVEIMHRFQNQFSIFALFLLGALLGIQLLILGFSFQPLRRIQTQIIALERGERKQLDTDVPAEVSVLVSEINRLLFVLQKRLQNSRNSLSDLAHALKTPLTVIQQLTDEEALIAHPDLRKTLNAQTSQMQRLVNRVLKRSRLAGGSPSTTTIPLDQELHDLVTAVQSIYHDKKLKITLDVPVNLNILFDREDMLELIGNLVDNACKWATSEVQIIVQITSCLQLIIEDDGPGVSETDLMKLSSRGTRLDESMPGYGLGLSIAQSIISQHAGQLFFGRSSKLGGFQVRVTLPLSVIPG